MCLLHEICICVYSHIPVGLTWANHNGTFVTTAAILTHGGRYRTDTILQATSSGKYSWQKSSYSNPNFTEYCSTVATWEYVGVVHYDELARRRLYGSYQFIGSGGTDQVQNSRITFPWNLNNNHWSSMLLIMQKEIFHGRRFLPKWQNFAHLNILLS